LFSCHTTLTVIYACTFVDYRKVTNAQNCTPLHGINARRDAADVALALIHAGVE
jgi:hypothetical protein